MPALTPSPLPYTAAFETPSATTDEEEAYQPRPTKNPRKAHGAPITLAGGIKGKKRAAAEAAAAAGGGGGGGEEEEDEEEEESGASPSAGIIGPSILKGEAFHGSQRTGLSEKLGGLTAIAKLKQDAADALAALDTKAESLEEGMSVPHDVFAQVLQVLNDAAHL